MAARPSSRTRPLTADTHWYFVQGWYTVPTYDTAFMSRPSLRRGRDGDFFANVYRPFLLDTIDAEYPLALASDIGVRNI